MKKLSYRVSLGGVVASLGVFFMFLTGFGPFFTYLCPMISGLLLIVISEEISPGWSVATYTAISILSLLTTPDREAAVMFIFFFGYYPILKLFLDKLKPVLVRWISKLLVFNAAVILAYWIIINLMGLEDFFEQFKFMGRYGVWIFLFAANVVFLMYDVSVRSLILYYEKVFRPKFFKKIK